MLPLKMKTNSQCPRKHFFDHIRLFHIIVENEDVAQASGHFYLWRENKIGEEKLDTGPILESKIGGGDFDQFIRLTGAGVAGHIEGIFDAHDHKQADVVVGSRFVAGLEGEFHEYRFHLSGIHRSEIFGGGVADVFFRKGKGGEEAEGRNIVRS